MVTTTNICVNSKVEKLDGNIGKYGGGRSVTGRGICGKGLPP